jgi:hypothetical protein
MSEKTKKVADLLLGGDESQTDTPVQSAKQADAKAEPVKPVKLLPAEQVKADAIAKFPKDTVAQTKYILDNSEHVSFIVPQMEGEIGEETVQINGYKLTLKKNVMVSVPIQVAQIIAEKYRINLEAGKEKKIDRASDVSEALG